VREAREGSHGAIVRPGYAGLPEYAGLPGYAGLRPAYRFWPENVVIEMAACERASGPH
jgi:hypothetical protein